MTKVLIIGGGIAGITVAKELACLGISSLLVEKENFLGGHAIQFACKATDECQKCNYCLVEKNMAEAIKEPLITIYLHSEIKEIKKTENDFTITITRYPQYISPQRCNNCGLCYEKCPYEGAVQKAYFIGHHPLYAISQSHCLYSDGCKVCIEICPEGAIDLTQSPKEITETVQAIVLAIGFTPFNPKEKPIYGYGFIKNVITALDLERMLREKADVFRPSDGKVPKKVAFIQCVGSRDYKLKHNFCSQVCCGYALRMARVIKQKHPDIEIYIFYMDIQTFGKDFEKFYHYCKEDLRLIRCLPRDVFPTSDDKASIWYQIKGGENLIQEEFDLVVLSIGLMPSSENKKFANMLNIELDEDGFFASDLLHKVKTSQAGIYLAGTVQGPKNIADTIAHASAAAIEVAKYLKEG